MSTSPAGAAQRLSPIVLACLAATWLIWGSTYLAIRFALVSFPPYIQMGSRFLVAGAGLAIWMRERGAPWPNARQWGHAFVIGGLMLAGGMGSVAIAEQTVGWARGGFHRNQPARDRWRELVLARGTRPHGDDRDRDGTRRRGDADTGPGVSGVARGIECGGNRLRLLVHRQRAEPAAVAACAGRHGIRE